MMLKTSLRGNNVFTPKLGKILITIFVAWNYLPAPCWGQIRSGASFLMIMPGARAEGLAGSLTGTIDNMYAVYANPGATGLLREWQWSLSYTNWIPGTYYASAFYGRGVRLPWNRHSRFALGVSYLGIKDFDSSKGRAPLASGGDVLLSASLGQPLTAISRGLSVGADVKYLRSRLDNFDADGFIFDVGLLYRTPRFRFLRTGVGLFDHAILSAGVAVTQLGGALHFNDGDTPLPRTFRAGASLNLGAHHGLQAHLTADYRRIRDEKGYFTIGTEFSWAQVLTFRGGYSFEKNNLLRQYTLGLSLGLSDVRTNLGSLIPGRNNAAQIDLARLQSNSWFDAPYRGSLSHYPVVPEHFEFVEPAIGETITTNEVGLSWQASRDPDLFDEVGYWLLVDPDSVKLAGALQGFESRRRDDFFALLGNRQFMMNDTLEQNNFTLSNLYSSLQNNSGIQDYFWTVVAYDKDRHYRIIEKSGRKIARFRVVLPDLQIHITEMNVDESQAQSRGIFEVAATLLVRNAGAGAARQVTIALSDSVSKMIGVRAPLAMNNPLPLDPTPAFVAWLPPDSALTISVRWQTPVMGMHTLLAWVDKANAIMEYNENNNWAKREVLLQAGPDLTIAKNASDDTVQAGETYEYRLTVSNVGRGLARDVLVQDILPADVKPFEFSAPPRAPRSSADTLFWEIDSLEAQQTALIAYRVKIARAPFGDIDSRLLEDITFEFDRDGLTAKAKLALDKIADFMAQVLEEIPQGSFAIGGHTDSIGTQSYNRGLSQRRAESVKAYLVSKNKIFELLKAEGYGESRPVFSNSSNACNRRVEIDIPRLARKIAPRLINRSEVIANGDVNPLNNLAADTVMVVTPPFVLPSLAGVNFYSGSAKLTEAAKQILDAAVPALRTFFQKDPESIIDIEGHTDNVGSDASNDTLSQRRAESVRDYFIGKCLMPERMRARGYGEQRPIDVNTTWEGRERNRRVELKVSRRAIS